MLLALVLALAAADPAAPTVASDQPHARAAEDALVSETAAALSEAFRTWLATEIIGCPTGPERARRSSTKTRFDLLQPRLIAILGRQRAGQALSDVIMNPENIITGTCPSSEVIDARAAEFEAAVGRLTAIVHRGEMRPFQPR